MKVYSTVTLLNHLNTQEAVIVQHQLMLLQLKIQLKLLLLAMMTVMKLPVMLMKLI
jgi:hypothetical protein